MWHKCTWILQSAASGSYSRARITRTTLCNGPVSSLGTWTIRTGGRIPTFARSRIGRYRASCVSRHCQARKAESNEKSTRRVVMTITTADRTLP
ncbi:hypothetical protein BR93DRAFT_681804 [Coniochaeta sp. PMI_546]|nr:hypothetical protein BR93DRAFT_681804 [Coniochaeta sp. PMI_546]